MIVPISGYMLESSSGDETSSTVVQFLLPDVSTKFCECVHMCVCMCVSVWVWVGGKIGHGYVHGSVVCMVSDLHGPAATSSHLT